MEYARAAPDLVANSCFLGNWRDDQEQYQALMDSGLTFAKAFNLRPGIALTADQLALLTTDIVWLQQETVTLADGTQTQVLVPHVYAAVKAGDLTPTGGLLSGDSVAIQTTGDITNAGTILGRKVVQIEAGNIHNLAGLIQAQDVALQASQDINNTGGTVVAGNSLVAMAGRDLNVSSTIASSSGTSGTYSYTQTGIDRVAGLYVQGPGVLYASAGNNINLTAAEVAGNGAVQLDAANNVNINTLTTSQTNNFNAGDAKNHLLTSQTSDAGSTISSGTNLTVNAGNSINAKAASLSAADTVTLAAKGNIVLDAGQTQSSYESVQTSSSSGLFTSTTTSTQTQASAATAQVSTVSAKNLSVIADQNLVSVGTEFKGSNSVTVEGKDTTTLYAATNTRQSTTTIQSTTTLGAIGGVLGNGVTLEDKTSTDSTATASSIGTKLISNEKVVIGVGNRTELQGTDIQSPETVFTKTGPSKAGELIIGTSKDTTQIDHTEKSETAGVWQEQKGQGSTTQTLNQTKISGNVSFDNALKITVQIPDTKGGQELKSQINALASQSGGTGLEYLNQLAANPNIQWDKVALANEKWSYSQAGLTPAGAALLTIAVAAYTGGMGSNLLGGTAATTTSAATLAGSTTLATAVNAGFASLASQAAVAMVNNGGDIGKTLEQLGKEESIKGLLTTMVTAGALNALGNSTLFNGQSGAGASGINGVTTSQAANQFTSNLLKNVTNNVAGAAIDSAINGKPLDEKALASALSNALITAGMAQGANSIGASDLNSFTNKLAHAALGCAGGAAMGGSCKSGAVGAVVGELAAEYINPNADPALKEQTLAFAKTMAAVAGVIVGGGGKNAADVNVAATAGANAAENNHMLHPPETRLAKRLAASATIRKPDGTAYTAEEVMEQLRLMGNKVTKQTPNTATALIGSEAIVNSVKDDPSLPKAIDGNVAVEKLGKPNAALQRYIIENTEGALGWLPDTSPYVASVPLDKPTTQKRPVNVTASCANGDTACITGIGQQQNAPLTQQARGAIADGASGLSRQAGVVAATATTVTTVAPPQVKPVSGAVAVGATVIGVGADAVEQLVRPDGNKVLSDALAKIVQDRIDKRLPVAAPITNELAEAWKASGMNKDLQTWSTDVWTEYLKQNEGAK